MEPGPLLKRSGVTWWWPYTAVPCGLAVLIPCVGAQGQLPNFTFTTSRAVSAFALRCHLPAFARRWAPPLNHLRAIKTGQRERHDALHLLHRVLARSPLSRPSNQGFHVADYFRKEVIVDCHRPSTSSLATTSRKIAWVHSLTTSTPSPSTTSSPSRSRCCHSPVVELLLSITLTNRWGLYSVLVSSVLECRWMAFSFSAMRMFWSLREIASTNYDLSSEA
jgi:hypothetical protein